MKKTVYSLISGLLLLLVCFCNCKAEELNESELYARSACLLDADTGRVLYAKDGDVQLPMASTTKIMTCILALENGHANDLVTASQNAASQPKVHMGVETGEQFLLNDLLYALMLESDNDAAVMIAEHIAGSEEAFAEKMNLKAKEIGCQSTYFITPNGLDEEDAYGVHSTTAVELAKILKYCIMDSKEKDLFLEITRTPSYTFWNNSHTKMYQCTNHNSFLNMMEGALTGKTGFTQDAGYCYVGALRSGDKTFIVALLACGWPNNKGYKWSDTRKLMNYGLNNYFVKDIFEQKELGKVIVENGQGERLGAVAETGLEYGSAIENMTFPLLVREDEKVEIIYDLPEKLEAPVRKGQQVGSVSYYIDGVLLKTYPVFAQKEIKQIDYDWCLEKIREAYNM